MTAPRISVLLPCLNDGRWIDDALRSVLDQTFQDFEIVIVDDGSTDASTVQKLQALSLARTRVLRTENRGLPAARNYAAAHAHGEIFCALDADDRLAAAWFQKGIDLLNRRTDVAFVSHWLETFGDEHWTWKPERCDLPALLARNTVNGAALVRRRAFEAVGGYDESMRHGCEDWDLWLRLVEAGWEGAIVPEVLFYYRRRADSMSRMMTSDTAYSRPLQMLLAKHERSYRQHLVSVVIAQEAERVALAEETGALERDRLLVLEPALERAAEELRAVERKAARARAARAVEEERERLAAQVDGLRREVDALRTSWSWRITAPLRAVYGRVFGRQP